MVRPLKPKTRKLTLRNRYERISKEKWFRDAYDNRSVGEAIEIADDYCDTEGELPAKGPKPKYTPKRKKVTKVTKQPKLKPVQVKEPAESKYTVDGMTLNFGELFNSINTNVECGIPVMSCDDVYYMEKLTGGKRITVGQAKEIAEKLRFMADSVNQQVYETLDARKHENERNNLTDILSSLVGKVLYGCSGSIAYIVPTVAKITGKYFCMEGMAVIEPNERKSAGAIDIPTKLGQCSYTVDLDDIATVPKNGDDDLTKLVMPIGTFVVDTPDKCLPEILKMVSGLSKMLHSIGKIANKAK